MVTQGRDDPARRADRRDQGRPGPMNLSSETGTLDPGKSADLIAVEGDPLVDPTAVQRVDYVMVEGKPDPDERTMMRSSLLALSLLLSSAAFAADDPACRRRSAQGRQGRRAAKPDKDTVKASVEEDAQPVRRSIPLRRPHARLHGDAGPPDDPQRQGRADREHVLRRLYGAVGAGRPRPVTFLFNGGPGSSTHVAAHGLVRADEGRRLACRRRSPGRRSATAPNPDTLLDVTRPRLHRCADDGPVARARQGRAEGLLRRRQGPRRLHPDDPALPHQIRPLEQPQVHHRRKLRHDARGGSVATRCSTQGVQLNGIAFVSTVFNFADFAGRPDA